MRYDRHRIQLELPSLTPMNTMEALDEHSFYRCVLTDCHYCVGEGKRPFESHNTSLL